MGQFGPLSFAARKSRKPLPAKAVTRASPSVLKKEQKAQAGLTKLCAKLLDEGKSVFLT